MNKMFNCQESALLELTHNEAWYRMIKDRNHVRIPGVNPIKISDYIKDQPDDEWEILDRDGVNIHEKEEFVNEVLTSPDKLLSHPSDVYFYDADALKQSKEHFGTLVLKNGTGDSKYLTRHWKAPLTKGQSCCWKTVLDKYHIGKTPPANALIIIDRYLFSYDPHSRTDYKNGIRNVFGLLNELLPPFFSGEFQVLIVFDDTKISMGATIDQIAKDLQTIKKKLGRSYVPTIELLTINKESDKETFSETHDRKIISNYFMITCGHGFSAILPPAGRLNDIDYIGNGAAKWTQTILYESIYAGIDADADDLDYASLPIRTCDYSISFMRDYLNKLKEGRKGYSYVCNGNDKVPIKEFRNRLLTNT